MARKRSRVPIWLVAAVVMAAAALILLQLPDNVFWDYSWVMFPGVFVAAIAGRVVEEQLRKRRLKKFRER